METRGSVFVSIRSRDLTNTNDLISSGICPLFEPIVCERNEFMKVSLISAIIPNSFNNISANNTNNIIKFKETGDADYKTITINDGSYDILEFNSLLKELLEANSTNGLTYTLTYDEINNTVKIQNSNPTVYNTTFNFLDNDLFEYITARKILGFQSGIYTINSVSGITSNRTVDITSGESSIYLRINNISNHKIIESSSSKFSNIVGVIGIPLSRNAIYVYSPNNPLRIAIEQKTISNIDLSLTYQNEKNKVDFSRGDFEINLEFSFHKLPERRRNHHSIHHQLLNQVDNYNRKIKEEDKKINELKQMRNQIKSN